MHVINDLNGEEIVERFCKKKKMLGKNQSEFRVEKSNQEKR